MGFCFVWVTLFDNSVKYVKDAESTVLANSYKPPHEYDFKKHANGARACMGNLLCGVEKVKHFVNVHLYYIVRKLKIIRKMSTVDVSPCKNFCGRPCCVLSNTYISVVGN